MPSTTDVLQGSHGDYTVHVWENPDARYVALIAHGIAEHALRYDHVAAALTGDGAVVYAPDHYGHGLSAGERGLVEDIEAYVDDLHLVADRARADHPGLPLVLIGHSLGGIIATRYAQRYMPELAALVLSGPVIGGNPASSSCSQWIRCRTSRSIPRCSPAIRPSARPTPPTADLPRPADAHDTRDDLRLGADDRRRTEAVDSRPCGCTGRRIRSRPMTRPARQWSACAPNSSRRSPIPERDHEIFNETNQDEVIGDAITFIDGQLVAA